jgi:hypothetical protein
MVDKKNDKEDSLYHYHGKKTPPFSIEYLHPKYPREPTFTRSAPKEDQGLLLERGYSVDLMLYSEQTENMLNGLFVWGYGRDYLQQFAEEFYGRRFAEIFGLCNFGLEEMLFQLSQETPDEVRELAQYACEIYYSAVSLTWDDEYPKESVKEKIELVRDYVHSAGAHQIYEFLVGGSDGYHQRGEKCAPLMLPDGAMSWFGNPLYIPKHKKKRPVIDYFLSVNSQTGRQKSFRWSFVNENHEDCCDYSSRLPELEQSSGFRRMLDSFNEYTAGFYQKNLNPAYYYLEMSENTGDEGERLLFVTEARRIAYETIDAHWKDIECKMMQGIRVYIKTRIID